MKKLISLILTFSCLISLVSVCAYEAELTTLTSEQLQQKASEASAKFGISPDSITLETAMPQIVQPYGLSQEALVSPARAQWVQDTAKYLENVYEQPFSHIEESEDFITFYFDVQENSETNQLSISPEELDNKEVYDDQEVPYYDDQVYMVQYVKPESALASTTYSTKFVYYWGWAEKYQLLDSSPSAGTIFNVSSSVMLMALAGAVTPLQSVVLTAFQMTISEFISAYSSSVSVLGKTYANYYFMNKYAYVLVNGTWLPGCVVGSRRGFNYCSGGYVTSGGQTVWTEITGKVGYPDNNPTNYDTLDKKPHYDDNTWLINKAIEYFTVYDTSLYNDIYGTALNKL